MTILEIMLLLLTDDYSKIGNNAKLLEIQAREYEQLTADINAILDGMDIDIAVGDLLKKLGENLLVFKGTDDDNDYRQRIRLKIQSIQSRGLFEDVISGLNVIVDDGLFELYELWDKSGGFHPAEGEAAALLVEVEQTITPRTFPRTFPDTFATLTNKNVNVANIKTLVAPGVAVYLLVTQTYNNDIIITETITKNVITPRTFPRTFIDSFGSVESEVL